MAAAVAADVAALAAAGFNCGMTCTSTVTATALKVERAAGQDGTAPTRAELHARRHGQLEHRPGRRAAAPTAVVSKAKWDGAKIVIAHDARHAGHGR